MRRAIDLNNQLRFRAGKVGDEVSDRMLAPKVPTFQLALLKLRPEDRFSVGQFAAHLPCELAAVRFVLAHLFPPSPLRGTPPASGGRKRARNTLSSPVHGGGGPKGRRGERASERRFGVYIGRPAPIPPSPLRGTPPAGGGRKHASLFSSPVHGGGVERQRVGGGIDHQSVREISSFMISFVPP